jgi:hypothetical protein
MESWTTRLGRRVSDCFKFVLLFTECKGCLSNAVYLSDCQYLAITYAFLTLMHAVHLDVLHFFLIITIANTVEFIFLAEGIAFHACFSRCDLEIIGSGGN